jgi:AraC-like DNA-binding protein
MIEPAYRLINPQANRSFVFKWEPFDLTTRWHYHPEIELIYFIKGRTTGVIGDGFHQFNEGDLAILGANFPHVLQEDKEYKRQHPDEKPFGLIIQFTDEFLGKDFFSKPELFAIKQLLKKAQRGLSFSESVVKHLSDSLLCMHELTETKKLFSLLQVLLELAETEHFYFLTPKDYAHDHTQDGERIREVNRYVYQNFGEKISIKEIAAIANMTESSFCRYFKSRTLKTFTQFLNETRISYACKLLNNEDYRITDACFESGFTNLSYFHRQFRTITKMSPKAYKSWKKGATTN